MWWKWKSKFLSLSSIHKNFESYFSNTTKSKQFSIKHYSNVYKCSTIKLNTNYSIKNNYNFIQKMGCASSKQEITISKATSPNKKQEESNDSDEYVEGIVCNNSDINENEMKTFDLEDAGRILLIKQNGQLSAIGAKCTHYGAPLVNGALGDGRVRCQWHGACFNILNGDIEDFPGLDSLPCYQVTLTDDNQVKVRAKRTELETNKRQKTMTKRDRRDAQNIIVIGGGPAGATCVETLRQEGYKGQLIFICKENCLPYDRVKVSKAMDFEIDKAQFRNEQFYIDNDIEVMKGIEATKLDTTQQLVYTSNGKQLHYDRLFIATGLRADKTNIPGKDLENVVVLRDYAHSVYVNAQLTDDKEVVVLGSSFVAMEAANYCLNKVKKVTLVARGAIPFKQLLGDEIGLSFMELFKEKGVNFVMNSGIVRCLPDTNNSNKVGSIELKDGGILKADLVIMGVGSSCYTEFLNESNLELRTDGSIEVNEYLQSNIKNVYVGGDIAHAPVWSYHNRKSTIGHYPLAHYHGRIAALNMLNKNVQLKAVPYFWTMLFGKGIRYAGHGKYTDIIYHGNVKEYKFVAFYLDGDEVVAASSCGMDPIVSQFAELLAQDKKLYRNDLETDPLGWVSRLHEK